MHCPKCLRKVVIRVLLEEDTSFRRCLLRCFCSTSVVNQPWLSKRTFHKKLRLCSVSSGACIGWGPVTDQSAGPCTAHVLCDRAVGPDPQGPGSHACSTQIPIKKIKGDQGELFNLLSSCGSCEMRVITALTSPRLSVCMNQQFTSLKRVIA